ncbi:hypothetical protein KCV06_g658, partial [Aureobasidium melanogenum]
LTPFCPGRIPNVGDLARYPSANAYHETKLDGEAMCHVYSNGGSRSFALVTAWEAGNNDIVLANLAESIAHRFYRCFLLEKRADNADSVILSRQTGARHRCRWKNQ